MPITKADFSSQALGLIRANSISSLDDGSNEADIVSLYYDTFVQDVFSRLPWSFALRKKALTDSGTTPVNEFQKGFHKPSEALKFFAMFNTDSVGAVPITDYWTIQEGLILSNETTMIAEYTFYTDEGNWPGYFIAFAIYAFAAMLAIPVTDDDGLAAQMQQLAYGSPSEGEKGGKFQIAAGIDARQQPPHPLINFELINSRFNSSSSKGY